MKRDLVSVDCAMSIEAGTLRLREEVSYITCALVGAVATEPSYCER